MSSNKSLSEEGAFQGPGEGQEQVTTSRRKKIIGVVLCLAALGILGAGWAFARSGGPRGRRPVPDR
jgi:hypothetical protein